MKMGRRLSGGGRIGHVSIQICSAPTASPARTALPAAHFDRNKMHAISGTGHQNIIGLQRKIKPNGIHLTEMRSHEVSLFPCRNRPPAPPNPLPT
jgi:hypothetical protein